MGKGDSRFPGGVGKFFLKPGGFPVLSFLPFNTVPAPILGRIEESVRFCDNLFPAFSVPLADSEAG